MAARDISVPVMFLLLIPLSMTSPWVDWTTPLAYFGTAVLFHFFSPTARYSLVWAWVSWYIRGFGYRVEIAGLTPEVNALLDRFGPSVLGDWEPEWSKFEAEMEVWIDIATIVHPAPPAPDRPQIRTVWFLRRSDAIRFKLKMK